MSLSTGELNEIRKQNVLSAVFSTKGRVVGLYWANENLKDLKDLEYGEPRCGFSTKHQSTNKALQQADQIGIGHTHTFSGQEMKFVMFQRHNFASKPGKCGVGNEPVPRQIIRFSTLLLLTFVPQAGKLTSQWHKQGAGLATAACCPRCAAGRKGLAHSSRFCFR